MTQCRGFFKFFNVTEILSGGEFSLTAEEMTMYPLVMEEPPDSQLMV